MCPINKETDMKRSIIYRGIYAGFMIMAIAVLGSCSKDTVYDINGDETNRVFFNVGSYATNSYNAYTFLVRQTPGGSVGAVNAAFPVGCTLEADAAITVKYAQDNSLIAAYNSENGTTYTALPEGLLNMSTADLTIPQGKLASQDSLKLSIPAEKLPQLSGTGYLIPITISTVASGKAEISTNMKTAYVIVNTLNTNL
jgi:hypothetical protein